MDKFQQEFQALLTDQQKNAVPVAIARHLAKVTLFELKGLDALYPDFKEKAIQLMANMNSIGKGIYLVQSFRSAKSQNGLPGTVTKAKGLQSYHQYGLACDFAFNDYDYTPPSQTWWDTLQVEAEKLGLESGNGWTGFQDRPHVEWHPGFTWHDLENYFA